MPESFKQISLRTTKEITSNLQPYDVVPCHDGGFLVRYRNSCLVSRYGPQYELLWQKEIGMLRDKYADFTLTVSPDGEFIGVHGATGVSIFDDRGNLRYSQEHVPWEFYQSSECYFALSNGEGKKYIWFFAPEKEGGGWLHVLDAADFSLVDSLWQNDIEFL